MATIFSGYLQWFFRVSAVLFFGCFLGGIGVAGCFYEVVGQCVSSCIQVVFLCWLVFSWKYFIIQEQQYFRAFLVAISNFYLSLYLCYYLLLLSLCVHIWGFYNCYIHTLLQCLILFSLISLICCYRLIYLALFNYHSHQRFFSHKILTFCLKLTVKIVKNILCNGFKRNVNIKN